MVHRAAIFLMAVAMTGSVVAQPPRATGSRSDRLTSKWTAERWLQQLANDLEHLQEDLHYERGKYPEGLRDLTEETSRTVAHFQHVLDDSKEDSKDDSKDGRHLRKDFEEMDNQVHRLVKSLETGDAWLRRQAARISYSDEQLHYTLRRRWKTPKDSSAELLVRQAHLLETEAKSFEALTDRVIRRDQRLRESIREFVEHADHFHKVVERGADGQHLSEDFGKVDDAWHRVVERVNSSPNYGYYLRTAAQNVNRIHNQIHELVNDGHDHPDHTKEQPTVPAKTTPPPPPRPRPAIEFEIPGLGRFEIPR